MHSVLLLLHSLISPRFYCIDHHKQLFSLSVRLLYWPNHSGYNWCCTHIPLLWVFRIHDRIDLLYIRFNVCWTIVFGVICIMKVASPVEEIFGVQNVFRCAILNTLDWVTVDSGDSADVQYCILSSREVLCRQCLWQRWSFWQFKCSRTIMLKVRLWGFDDLFSVQNVSYGGHLLVLGARFLLGST